MDEYCENNVYGPLHILNIKPGLTDTPITKNITGDRMTPDDVVFVIDFVLKSRTRFKIHSMSFGL